MTPRESMRTAFVTVLVLRALLVSTQDARAQDLPENQPPAVAHYCPNNTPGQCFKSRMLAEAAMRAAEPEVGQYLAEQSPEPDASSGLRFLTNRRHRILRHFMGSIRRILFKLNRSVPPRTGTTGHAPKTARTYAHRRRLSCRDMSRQAIRFPAVWVASTGAIRAW